MAPADRRATFDVRDPSTGDVIARSPTPGRPTGSAPSTPPSPRRPAWAATRSPHRSDILRRAFDLLRERADDLALLMTLEMGKPLAESRGEVAYGSEFVRWASEEAVRVSGRYGTNPEGTGRTVVLKRPVGPVPARSRPGTSPSRWRPARSRPPSRPAAPSSSSPPTSRPLTTLALVGLLAEAGVPRGVVNVVTTTSAGDVCEPLIRDPRLRKLSFTGSTPVGSTLLAQASERVLRTSMELGGNAPFLVFDDADLDAAVEGALLAKFRNVGQACTAANRFLVHEAVADEFVRRVTERVAAMTLGRGTDEGSTSAR